jgi:hypothetical protein
MTFLKLIKLENATGVIIHRMFEAKLFCKKSAQYTGGLHAPAAGV